MNMTRVIGLDNGRVKADICTLSKRVAEEDTRVDPPSLNKF